MDQIEPVRLDTNLLQMAMQANFHAQGQEELQRHHAVIEEQGEERTTLQGEKIHTDELLNIMKDPTLPAYHKYQAAREVYQLVTKGQGRQLDPVNYVDYQQDWNDVLTTSASEGTNSSVARQKQQAFVQKNSWAADEMTAAIKRMQQGEQVTGAQQTISSATGQKPEEVPLEQAALAAQHPDAMMKMAYPPAKEKAEANLLTQRADNLKVMGALKTAEWQAHIQAPGPSFDIDAEQDYLKEVGSTGLKGPLGQLENIPKRNERLARQTGALTPEARKSLTQQLPQEIDQIQGMVGILKKQLEMAQTDTTGKSPDPAMVSMKIEALQNSVKIKNAELAYAQSGSTPDFQKMRRLIEDRTDTLQRLKDDALNYHQRSTNTESLENKIATRNQVIQGQQLAIDLVNGGAKIQDAANQASKKSGASVQEILPAFTDPNKPSVQVQMYDPKQSVTTAGQLVNLTQSLREIKGAREMLIDPKSGAIDRTMLGTAAMGLPFSKGREFNTYMEKAVEIKLRAATGAAAPIHEVKNYLRMFAPSIKDSDDLIKYKLDAMEEWLQSTADLTDPLGSLRQRADTLLSPGISDMMKSPDYQRLRKNRPNASVKDIVKYLESKKSVEP